MQMKNPPHPGKLVRDCLEELGITVTEAAQGLGVTRQALTNVICGKVAVSPEMAIRLAKAFGSSPDCWLRMQNSYDLSRLSDREFNVRRYKRASLTTLPS